MPRGRLEPVRVDQIRRGQFVDLLAPEHRRTTLILWFIWFANAFSYYGIVLLTTEMFQIGNACKGLLPAFIDSNITFITNSKGS